MHLIYNCHPWIIYFKLTLCTEQIKMLQCQASSWWHISLSRKIWHLTVHLSNSLQLWINLGKGNIFRLRLIITPTSEGNIFWFLIPSSPFSFVSLKYIYSISGYSEFEVIYYAYFFKWGIWLLFPVVQLYLGFFEINMDIQNKVCGSLEVNINFIAVVFVSI